MKSWPLRYVHIVHLTIYIYVWQVKTGKPKDRKIRILYNWRQLKQKILIYYCTESIYVTGSLEAKKRKENSQWGLRHTTQTLFWPVVQNLKFCNMIWSMIREFEYKFQIFYHLFLFFRYGRRLCLWSLRKQCNVYWRSK